MPADTDARPRPRARVVALPPRRAAAGEAPALLIEPSATGSCGAGRILVATAVRLAASRPPPPGTPDTVRDVIRVGEREHAAKSAPPDGLCFMGTAYPEENASGG